MEREEICEPMQPSQAGAAPSSGSQDADGRIATVPNAISLARILGVGIFALVLSVFGERLAAAILLGFIGATDWVDGYVARRFNQVSELGKVLDPVADRIVFVGGGLAIYFSRTVPGWVFFVVLAREVIISAGVGILALAKVPRIDVTFVGKAGTFVLMCAFPLFLLAHSGAVVSRNVEDVAMALACVGMVLSWVALFGYIPRARQAIGSRGPESEGGI